MPCTHQSVPRAAVSLYIQGSTDVPDTRSAVSATRVLPAGRAHRRRALHDACPAFGPRCPHAGLATSGGLVLYRIATTGPENDTVDAKRSTVHRRKAIPRRSWKPRSRARIHLVRSSTAPGIEHEQAILNSNVSESEKCPNCL